MQPPAPAAPAVASPARILIVDDRPENLLALEAILDEPGYALVRAASGEDALRRMLHEDFALILLDVQMPVLSGFETAALIKERERSRHVPIIFLTALSTEDRYAFQGYQAGAVDYLTKPFHPEILRSKVAVFVELWRKNEQLREQAERLRESDERERRRALELVARNRGLDAFAALTAAVGAGGDPRLVLASGLTVLAEHLGDAFAMFYERGPDGAWHELEEVGRAPARAVELACAALEAGAGDDGQPVFYDGALDPSGDSPIVRSGRSAALAIVPVRAGDRRDWVLACGVNGRADWSDPDRAVARSVAQALGLALERSQLVERLADQADRLAQQNAELEARNAEQETFVYTVSHDLRTPLISIQGMASLLAEAVRARDEAEATFLLERVTTNVDRMTQLLNDLLALSRAGRSLAEAEPLDLGEIAASVLRDLAPRLDAREVEVVAPEDWPPVLYPKLDAYQLLSNLLGNAVKWSGRPGERPRVSLSRDRADDGLVLRVHDNGPGVPERYRERVFGLFQRLDAATEGTGVGLAIVKRIAERNGGRVWIEDSPLGGAAFAVTLPAAE